jgi:hypothetical protein
MDRQRDLYQLFVGDRLVCRVRCVDATPLKTRLNHDWLRALVEAALACQLRYLELGSN